MNITRFISRRYLFSRKHVSLISVLTSISIAGITLGTALLIIILSVFNGFFDVIRGFLLSFDPDIRIEMNEANSMTFDPALINRIQDHPEVVQVAPYVEGKAMLISKGNQNDVVIVRGIERSSHIRISDLEQSVQSGVFDLSVQNGRPGLVISNTFSNQYGLGAGDEIVLLSAAGMRRAITQFSAPRVSRFQVRGSYNIQQIIDDDIAYINLEAAQRLFNMQNEITGLDLQLTDTDRAGQVKEELQQLLGPDYRLQSWYDLQKPLYDVMYLEKWGSYLILMIIVLVAALNIVGSLTMIVIQKKKDIGVLISMGMTSKKIKQIFISQGIQIGIIGCGIGGVLGVFTAWLQQEYGLVKLTSSFIIDAYPVSIQPLDIVLVVGGSLILCLAASWYPATRAAAVEPADAVRGE
ncbi:FtsX-like permease family protein [Rhodohalobacter sp.]|uniref:FtsX-like permease family protein n=1 Tax=Rhodohalobacter sp. TaxID=1974210 RepID=UPI002ACE4641|nr:FtsX-like permease family protein [Rhodohalobacter sp.]MDZ7755741.1 FtsX-like permease family protein [Rhodohalobacter sp.]